MAIVKMEKFTLFTFQEYKQELLSKIQAMGEVQFINTSAQEEEREELQTLTSGKDSVKIAELEEEFSKVKYCLEQLDEYHEGLSGLAAMKKGKDELTYDELAKSVSQFEWESIYNEIKALDNKMSELNNEQGNIENEIELLQSWKALDIGLKDVESLQNTEVEVGTIPLDTYENLTRELSENLDGFYIEMIEEVKEGCNVVVAYNKQDKAKADECLLSNNFVKFTLQYQENPKETLNSFTRRLGEIEREKENLQDEFKKLAVHIENLQHAYEYYNSELVKTNSTQNFMNTDTTVILEGWVPSESKANLEKLVEEACGDYSYVEFTEAKDEVEETPIKLKNSKFVRAFENITAMYSMPNYAELDPTPVLSLFYVFFFGMMLSDAGYGLILVLGSFFALNKLKLEEGMRDMVRMFYYVGWSTIAWGIVFGSYFGNFTEEFFGFAMPRLIDQQADIIVILVLSIAFGLVHIYVGLGMKAYILIKAGKIKDFVFDVLTWYASVTGLVLLLLGVGIGGPLTVIGLLGLLLTQGRDSKSLGGKIGGGVYGLYGITSYIGDLVSYSRLLALGLATAFISLAFNLIINLVVGGMILPLKIVVGVVMFVILHGFNLGINALGTYVHTSRLQYLEFFNKFYEGGGKDFVPLNYTNKYVNIKKK